VNCLRRVYYKPLPTVAFYFEIDEEVGKELEMLRENMGVKRVSDVVALLLKDSRRHLLNEAFGTPG